MMSFVSLPLPLSPPHLLTPRAASRAADQFSAADTKQRQKADLQKRGITD